MFGYWWQSTIQHKLLWISDAYSSLFIPTQRVLHILRLTVLISYAQPISVTGWQLFICPYIWSHDAAMIFTMSSYILNNVSPLFPFLSSQDRTSCLPLTTHTSRHADMTRTIIPIVPSLLWEIWLTGLDTISRTWQQRQVLQTTLQVKTSKSSTL